MPRRAALLALFITLILGISACASRGDVDNPMVRKFTWFSYLNGDDLRAECLPGGPDRYRLILNNRYQEQVRMYELTGPIGAVPARLHARVQGRTNLLEVIPFLEQQWAWHGKVDIVSLDDAQYDKFLSAMKASGAFGPPPIGEWLNSDGTYWVSIACRAGAVSFNAWAYPGPRFDGVTFDDVLWSLDMTEIPVTDFVTPRTYSERYKRRNNVYDFSFEVGESGLKGARPLVGGP